MIANLNENYLKYCYYLSLIGAFIIIAFYCYIFINFSSNAPYFDDFFWGFTFLDEYINATSFSEKLRLIFQQHAQHRIAYFRLFIIGHYHLFGTINFKTIAIFANFSNLVLFFVIAIVLGKHKIHRFFILPLALILFQFQYYQNIISTYGFPNMAVYMWAILAFYFQTKSTNKALIITILCAIFSVFSNGNGILAFPIILFFIFIQKRYKHFVVAAFIFLVFVIIYFAFANDMATQPLNLMQSTNYFLKFLSAAFFTNHNTLEKLALLFILISFLIKFTMECYSYYFFNRKIENIQMWIVASSTIFWIIATALSVSLFRATSKPSIPNWYFNYSILLLIFYTLFFLSNFKNNYFKVSFFVLISMYAINNYDKNLRNVLPTIHGFHSNLEADVVNFNNHKKWAFLLTQVSYPMYKKFEIITNNFYKKGNYKPDILQKEFINIPSTESMVEASFNYTSKPNDETSISFEPTGKNAEKTYKKKSFGFIKSDENIYYFGTVNLFNLNNKDLFFNGNLFENKPFFVVAKTYFDIAIKKGDYQIGMVFFEKNEKPNWFISDKKLSIENY